MLSKKVLVATVCLMVLAAVAWVGLRRAPITPKTGTTASNSAGASRRATTGVSSVAAHAGARGAAGKSDAGAAWGTRFRDSTDYFAFIAEAAKRAYAGDGRAAYYVGESVAKCAVVVRMYHNSADPAGQLKAEYETTNSRIPIPQWIKDKQYADQTKCIRLVKEDPFVGLGLPDREGGYFTSNYWHGLALADKDPLAEARAATFDLNKADNEGINTTKKGEMVSDAQSYMRDAVASDDPDVLFLVGMTLANPRYSADPTRGLSIALAACELGYDCSPQNPANTFSVCKDSGTCPADADFQYYLQQSMTADAYAKMYARAQDFKELLSRGDAAALEPFTRIDGSML